jgi:MFS family permease
MLNGTIVFATALVYVFGLFLIAWWGDRGGRRFLAGRARALV